MGLHSKLLIPALLLFLVITAFLWLLAPLLPISEWIFIALAIYGSLAFFVWRISHVIIQPLVLLARATDEVASGHLHEIALPSIGDRKDEIALLVRGFEHMIKGLEEREEIRALLDKVVSREIAEEIIKKPPHLGGEDRVVTMLFSDIRDFTTLTEDLTPQKTIEILNFYMTKMAQVIEHEGGLIDKFVGDEIMALFGAPVAHPQHALRAISTGLLMLERCKKINEERKREGQSFFEMGIAIHTGLVVAGNMGAEDRLNYTVLGRNVNLAARLCHAAHGGQLLISEQTYQEPLVKESFLVKPLQPISLRGFTEPVQIYEVVSFQWKEDDSETPTHL